MVPVSAAGGALRARRPLGGAPFGPGIGSRGCRVCRDAFIQMAEFIEISVDRERIPPDTARALVSLCPVEIFAWDGGLQVRPGREDECTLCELCLEAAPAGALVIRKKYKDQSLISRG